MSRVISRILAVAVAVVCTLMAAAQPRVASAASTGYVAPMTGVFATDLYSLPETQSYGGFVHFNAGTAADHRSLLSGYGLQVTGDFERSARAVFAVGTIGAFRALAGHPSVAYLEDNRRLQYDANNAGWSTRARVAQEPVSGGPYRDASGRLLRGQGVTIVVVDSGLNAQHPDFAGRVLHNWKIVCSTPGLSSTATGMCFGPYQIVDVGATDSDTTGGHGTHCAGIAAGSGAASTGDYSSGVAPNVKGTYTGAAPDAKIIAYGAGEGLSILTAAEAYQHMLDNWDPTIRVVSNSWGSAGAYDPNSVVSKLTKLIVAKGAVVARSAGNGDTLNDGGDGSDDRTRRECKDPTPGVICVANVDEGGTGSRSPSLDFSSSRGLKTNPLTYPDIAAPGAQITASCEQPLPGQAVCTSGETTWQPYYGTISGTSMSTPHVAGVAALIAQANPSLTPGAIESLMKRTALKLTSNGAYVADPRDATATINFGLGAGLLDVPAALNAAGTAHDGFTAAGVQSTIFDGYTMSGPGAANVQKLTMQESTVGTTTGITYRLTLANATGFTGLPNGVTYQLHQNVDGVPFVTSISATSTTVSVVPNGSGDASSVSRSGNVVTFFVPYVQLGSPPVGAPIHNIAVFVYDNTAGAILNVAPHPANATGASATLQPMYGKPFTTRLAASGGGGGESSCLVPGLTVVTDGVGDSLLPTPGSDLRGLGVAEPYASTASGNLVFTLKTDPGRALQPVGSGWYVSFSNPRDHKVYGARMLFKSTAPTFESYVASGSLNTSDPNAEGQTDGRFADVTKPADPNSNYDHLNGRITIIVPMSDVNVQPGDTIGGFNGGSTFTTNPQDLPGPSATDVFDPMPDSFAYVGSFTTYAANGATCPVAAAPKPRLSTTSLSFGDWSIGAGKSGALSVVYTNTWTQPLPVGPFATASQTSVAEFMQTNDCPTTLAVGQSCTVSVTFRPLQAGARNGTLTIVANNGRRIDTVNLTGNGVGP